MKRALRQLVLSFTLVWALPFAASSAAQTEPAAPDSAAQVDTRAPAERILDSVEAVSAWRSQLLQRFASDDSGEFDKLRAALDNLVARRNSPIQDFSFGEYPAFPASITDALRVVEHRRKLSAELEVVRDAIAHPADSSFPDGEPLSIDDTLQRVTRVEHRLDLQRARAELEAGELALKQDQAFLDSVAAVLETDPQQTVEWNLIASEKPESLDAQAWAGLGSVTELQRAANKVSQRLRLGIATVSLRIAGDSLDPVSGHEELARIEPAVEALERAYVRVDRRLALIASDVDPFNPTTGIAALPQLRASLRKVDQEETALRWLIDAEQQRWEVSTPLLKRLFADLGSSWLSLRSGSAAVLNYSLFQLGEASITLGGVLRVLGILLAAWFASKWLRRGLDRYSRRRPDVSRPALYAAGRVLHYLLIAIGISFALSAIGLDLTKVAFFASALGVGIGFGLQGIVNNFISGLILLFERSLKIGDFVELESGVTGEVTDISIRATRVTTNDNIDILVPNSEFVNGRVTSWTLRETARRIKVKFGVAYGTDKELVKKAALEAADAVPFTFANEGPRRSQVWLVGFGDSSLDFQLVVWLTADAVKRPGAVQAAYYWALEDALGNYGIEIPFPQRDLHVRSLFSATEDDAKELWRGRKKSKSGKRNEREISDSEREALSGNDALQDALGEAPRPTD